MKMSVRASRFYPSIRPFHSDTRSVKNCHSADRVWWRVWRPLAQRALSRLFSLIFFDVSSVSFDSLLRKCLTTFFPCCCYLIFSIPISSSHIHPRRTFLFLRSLIFQSSCDQAGRDWPAATSRSRCLAASGPAGRKPEGATHTWPLKGNLEEKEKKDDRQYKACRMEKIL